MANRTQGECTAKVVIKFSIRLLSTIRLGSTVLFRHLHATENNICLGDFLRGALVRKLPGGGGGGGDGRFEFDSLSAA